ncbi:MAG: hypothetical protein ACNFW9_03895 [Candidatus Kerfeldbacteria bacterium]|jgi:uncharacterized protein (DUF885 family)
MENFGKSPDVGKEEVKKPVLDDNTSIETETGEDNSAEMIKSALSVREGLGKALEDFYSTIKKKFNNEDADLTLSKLAAASTEKLGPIIQELRMILKKGGSADPDSLIQAIISEAQTSASQGIMKHDFLERITSMNKISPDSKIAKFNKFAAKGLEK